MNNVDDNMHHSENQDLAQLAWRCQLAPAEQARLLQLLDAHPHARKQWEYEAALTRGLNGLPPAPVSSNFTALVMQAVQRAPARPAWQRWFDLASWLPAGWMPRLAVGAAMVCLSFVTFREYQILERQKMGRDLANVSRLAALPPMEWLQNFDTINRLNRVKVADDDLLLVLQ
jgi:hypothetical protein